MADHLIGMLLGTEEDWPTAFETVFTRYKPTVSYKGETHTFSTERITIEPFDLRMRPRHAVVIDRLAYWYYQPREWLKKIALMNDVYLLNNPFTFQAMEKHSAYCALIRLGFKIPETWLIPSKQPPDNPRYPYTAAKYNLPFDLDEIAASIGYPLFMKPFDGGQWVGVTRIDDAEQLHRSYDLSGERYMHLQKAIPDYDVFARSLSIGAETMAMRFDPSRPMHDRYRIEHDFLEPEIGREVLVIGRLVNAFFRWEFNSCETLVRGREVFPIDYANACPDISLTSLHYYFPWAITALAKWAIFCATTGRVMPIDQDHRRYFEIGDREDLSYEEKLSLYETIVEDYFDSAAYQEFCAEHLSDLDGFMVDYVSGPEFDRLIVDTVTATFPPHEHEQFIAHYRGLLGAWAEERPAG